MSRFLPTSSATIAVLGGVAAFALGTVAYLAAADAGAMAQALGRVLALGVCGR